MALNGSIFYPTYGTRQLQDRYGQSWSDLLFDLDKLPRTHPCVMAYALLIRRLNRQAGSKQSRRIDPLCTLSATKVLAQFNGTERELLKLYQKCLAEVNLTLKAMRHKERKHHRRTIAA